MFNSKMFNQVPFNGGPGQQPIEPAVQVLEMLYLFDPDESLVAVLRQDSFFSPKHYEMLNGANTFTFSFPGNKEDAQYITEGNLVGYKDLDVAWHLFEITRIVDLHGDGLTRTAFCEHIFYELRDDIVTDKRPSGSALSALTAALEGTRWQVGIVDDLGAASTNFYYESALSAVKKVADAWQGELRWRCFMSGGTITRYVDLLAARGSDTGKQFVYGKDILKIERESDPTGIVTALYGRGKGVETESGEGYGRRLTFADVVWSIAAGDPVDKPAGQEWVGDPAALTQWGRGGRHRFSVFIDEDETDPAALLQKTWDSLQEQKDPRVTYRLKVITLETLSGYSHEAVRMGDLVRALDREFKPELLVSARVVELERDLQNPANTEVVLGSFAPMIIDTTINIQRKVKEMANKPFNTKWLDGKISVLQNEIENTQSYVFQTPGDGILIMDAPTFALATKAMKMGGGIFALANTKTGDQWNWRTFGDGSGFTADGMTAGVLNAALVSIISAGGNFTIDGTGAKVYDSDDNLRIHIGEYETGKYGAKIIDGEIYGSLVRSGEEGAKTFIQLTADGYLEIWSEVLEVGQTWGEGTSKLQLRIAAIRGGGGSGIDFYEDDTRMGQIQQSSTGLAVDTIYEALNLRGKTNVNISSQDGKVNVTGLKTTSTADIGDITPSSGVTYVHGDIYATGDVLCGGPKTAVEWTENYGQRYVYAVEASELLYYDRGVAGLGNGECVIQLDPIFLDVIEPDTPQTPWTFWTESYGENDVYVYEWGSNYFKVRERNNGKSSNKFAWRFEATRKDYAGIRLMEVIKV